MNDQTSEETIKKFLKKVMEVESNPSYMDGSGETNRKKEIKDIISTFCGNQS